MDSDDEVKTRVLVVEIPLHDEDEDNPVTDADIDKYFRIIMADALSEFYRSRGYTQTWHDQNREGVIDYVERRYAACDEKFRTDKIPQVMKRCLVAKMLHQGFFSPNLLSVKEG